MIVPARIRLTAFYTAIFTTVLILSSVFVYARVSRSLHNEFRSEMVHDGRLMAELFKEELRLNAINEFEEELEEFGFDLQVLDAKRKPIAQSDGWDKLNVPINEATHAAVREKTLFREMKLNERPYAVFSRAIHIPGRGDYALHMARSQVSLKKTLSTLLQWMIAIKFVMVIIAAFIGYWFATRTLRAEEKAHARLRNFTADASHELRIPITSLRGHLEVALRRQRSAEEYQVAIENALEEAEHLSKITRDLLLLSQTDAGQLKLSIQPVALKSFTEDVFDQLAGFPDVKRISKKLRPVNDATVYFDPDRVRQLLLILVDNALKYGRENGTIVLESRAEDGKTVFKVEDDGIGIPAKDLDKIFTRFYRVDKSRSREMGGTGLGLSIAQWIASAHNGTIRVESQEGKGSIFTVTLASKPA